jgi:serine/threonine-protein kinase
MTAMTSQLAPGFEIAGYRIQEALGRGGMGVVYRAEHPRLQSVVALKLLSPELAEDQLFRERFVLESQLASSLNDPHIIPVYDAGEANGQCYLAMRLVEGPSLRTVIRDEGALDAGRAVALLAQVASALDAAHARGLVHRDVKPENVLIASGGATEYGEHAYLTDFGVSKQLASNAGLTRTGQLVGTLRYVAPEQIEGRQVDGACDQYALGCVVYETLTGTAPFVRESDATMLWAHMHDAPPKVTAARHGLPAAVDAVVARMLAKAPQDRYPTCGAALAACRVALGGGARTAPRPRRKPSRPLAIAAASVGVVAGIAAGVLVLTDSSPAHSAATPAGMSEAHKVGKAVPLALVHRTVAVPQRRKPAVKPKPTPKVKPSPAPSPTPTPTYRPTPTVVHTTPKPAPAPTTTVTPPLPP